MLPIKVWSNPLYLKYLSNMKSHEMLSEIKRVAISYEMESREIRPHIAISHGICTDGYYGTIVTFKNEGSEFVQSIPSNDPKYQYYIKLNLHYEEPHLDYFEVRCWEFDSSYASGKTQRFNMSDSVIENAVSIFNIKDKDDVAEFLFTLSLNLSNAETIEAYSDFFDLYLNLYRLWEK